MPTTLLAEGRHHEASWWRSRPEAGVEMRAQIRRPRRETAAVGAVPARPVRNRSPGRLRELPWGHYDPCARSSLTAPVSSRGRNARTGGRAYAEAHSLEPPVERREASAFRKTRAAPRQRGYSGALRGAPLPSSH